MRRALAIAGFCLCVGSVTAAMADGATSGLHSCGDKGRYFAYDIKADFSCRKGIKVVRGWSRGVAHGGSADRNVKGFRCNYTQKGYELAKVSCKTSDRKVKWITGS